MEKITSIEDQVVVIAAGGAGIGLACAERFAAEGAKVAVLDRDEGSAAAIVEKISVAGGDAMFATGDCTSESDMDAAGAAILDRWGRLDVLVNCAGGFHSVSALEDLDLESWRAGLDWNLSGIFVPTRAFVPTMKLNSYGRIVNIGSMSGSTGAAVAAIEYSTAKAGVAGFSRRMAVELAPFGITVNTVMPGPIWTERFAAIHGDGVKAIAASVPVGRLGAIEEIAHAVWFLCTPGSGFTTGVTFDVNGGLWTG